MTVLCITQDGHFIVIEIYFVHEHINQCTPIFEVIDVPFTELVQEKANVLHTGDVVLGCL